jgi:hypothetical protein
MSLTNKVQQSLKWKQSAEQCANRLGISLTAYLEIKEKLKEKDIKEHKKGFKNKVVESKNDVENGTKEIKLLTSEEPRTPEEVEELVKIKGSDKWILSNFYNKQQHNGLWLITAFITQKKLQPKELLEETLKNFKPQYTPITKVFINKNYTPTTVGVLSIQDLHFGKENNENIAEDFKKAITNLVYRAYQSNNLDKLIYVIGGDLFNMDTFSGTTTSGTPLDNSMRAQEAYQIGFDSIYWSVNYLKQFCRELNIVYLPGNHDRLSSYHLAHAISKCFFAEPNITFDVEYAERKVVVYGNNFFGFEHGDVTKKNTPLVYATEFSEQWGLTKYRTCFTGHFHSKKTIEYITENEHNGFSVKHLPSLCSSDYWHYHNKFVGSKRQAILEIHDWYKGRVAEFIYSV